MGIDSSIALGVKPVQIESPMNALAQMMQIQQVQQSNQLNTLKMDEYQRGVGETNRVNALYSGAIKPDGTIDRTKLISGAASQNLGSKIPGMQKGFLDTDEAQGKVDKQRIDLVDAKLKQSRSFLDSVKTPDEYMAWHEGNHTDPVLGPVLAARGITAASARASIEEALKKPGGFQEMLTKSALGIEKFSEMNKPSVHVQNLGGTSQVISTPGMGGAPVMLSNSPITQSADSVATNATSRQNNAASVGATVRGQDLTDVWARDLNATKVEENKIKREQKDDERNLTKNSQIASFDTMLGTLDRLGKHPGLSRSVGITGAFPTMPGSDSANFQASLDTFQSQAFLPMVAQLKGMGALSDAEGKKLTQAVGELSPKMGEKAFRESVARITDDMQAARSRVSGTAQPAGKTVTRTGTVNGKKVVQYSDGSVDYAN